MILAPMDLITDFGLVSQAAAQSFNLDALMQPGASMSGRMIQIGFALTALSIAPTILVTMTSFTRLVVALSFLRSGLGLQSTPANIVMISLALFMTFFTMSPVFERAWNEGAAPLLANSIPEGEAIAKIGEPFREFMSRQVRDKDLKLLTSFAHENAQPVEGAPPEFRVLVPAFMMSELRRGFEMGFLIALPFLVIDLIVATIVMSMGMMMLPPSVISLPIKVIFFVLIDGWSLLIGSLLRSFH